MKKKIGKKDYHFLAHELKDLAARGEITGEQLTRILDGYEAEQEVDDYLSRFNFIKTLLTIGALLVGLGVLTFIASNWQEIGKPFKFSLLIMLYLGVNYAAYALSERQPKTGRSLVYLGALVYGAGIFLIGQMFHYGGHFPEAFLLWALGILPLMVILRDKILFVFVNVLFLAYLNSYAATLDQFALFIVPAIIGLYYLNYRFFENSGWITFFTNLIVLNSLLVALTGVHLDSLYIFLIFFAIGLAMYFLPVKFNAGIFRVQGHLIFGLTGLALTISHVWYHAIHSLQLKDSLLSASAVSTGFALVFAGLLLYLIRRESLISLVFLCILIFRYYVDTMYDFLPKSVFFIISGLLLLGFGYYIERQRKAKGGKTGVHSAE